MFVTSASAAGNLREVDREPRVRSAGVDLALPMTGAAVWIGAAAGWRWAWPGAGVVIGFAVLVSCGAWWYRGTTKRWGLFAALLTAIAATAGAVVAAASCGTLEQPAINEPAARHAHVVAAITTTSETKVVPKTRSWQEPSVALRARLTRIDTSGRTWTLDVPVRVIAATDSAWTRLPVGAQVRAVGKLLPRRAEDDSAATLRATRPPEMVAGVTGVSLWLHRMRQALRDATAGQSVEGSSLVAGLAVGDESRQSEVLGSAMRDSGLSHLTAVSGGNTALVLLIVIGLARLARFPPPAQWAAGVLALGGYVALVGPQPSVLRAAGMGAVALIGLWRGGFVAGLAPLGAAVTLLLLISPGLSMSLGFGLSVAATTGLLLVAPRVRRWMLRIPGVSRIPGALPDAVAITVAAQIATAPLVLVSGGTVSWVALPANLLAAPVVAPITFLGLLTALIGPLVPAVASVVVVPAIVLAGWLARLAHTFADLADTTASWSSSVPILLGLAGGGSLVWTARLARRRRSTSRATGSELSRGLAARIFRLRSWPALVVVVAVLALARPSVPRPSAWPPSDWRAIVCDVGQGSAALIRTESSEAILVDTGPESGGVARCLADARVTRLAGIVLSHFHADHVGDLAGVVSRWRPEQILVSPRRDPERNAVAVEQLSRRFRIPIRAVTGGDQFQRGLVSGRFIWPERAVAGTAADANNSSLVLLVTWSDPDAVALFPGDIEIETQNAIMRGEKPPRPVDLVAVPHHGSAHQHPGFARWVGAGMAAISAGAGNDYGHPAQSAMSQYTVAGSRLTRTDVSGSWAFVWANGRVIGMPEG